MAAQVRLFLPVILALFFILATFPVNGWASSVRPANVSSDESFCRASEAYLAEISDYQASGTSRMDSSCLTDYASVAKNLASYQIIDIRNITSAQPKLENAWHIPVRELRAKTFLRDRALLLIGPAFSRTQAATDCSVLQEAGFTNVKILVGGAHTWATANQSRSFINAHITKRVSAKDLVFEYFNGQVTLVATSEPVAKEVESLGMKVIRFRSGHFDEEVQNLAITETDGGFYPVAVISDHNRSLDDSISRLPNVFLLEGGAAALAAYLQDNQWTNLNRTGVPRRYMCGSA